MATMVKNTSRAARPVAIIISLLVLLLLACAGQARANVNLTPYGSSSDPRPGAHGDLITGANFTYSPATDQLKSVLIDLPYGGVGNPNAVPYEDRCPLATFQTGTCPPSSIVGEATVDVVTRGIAITLDNQSGPIAIIQTTPEVPTVVGAFIQPKLLGVNASDPVRTLAKYYPVTSGPDGDFRIRTQIDEFPTKAMNTIIGSPDITIKRYQQKLNGVLSNGNPFITNPTRCDAWLSYGYGKATTTNTNANSDPFQTGANEWVKTDKVDTPVNCGTLAPFTTTADASVSGTSRGGNSGFTTDLKIPGLAEGDQGAAAPKTVVATLPDAVNVDVQQLNRVCSNEQFAARACPANSKFGTVNITTPMIKAGLAGDAYLVKRADGQNGLPDLGLIVSGAINFSVRGTNKYTGANFTQIQSTFDNIPAIGFSSFKLALTGGTGSLLKVDECPTSGKEPKDGGPTTFTITTYQGQTKTFASPTSYASPPCLNYTVKLKSISKCVKRGSSFKVRPVFKSTRLVKYVTVSLTKSKLAKSKKSPFTVRVKTSKKLKKNHTYKYTLRAYFKPDATHKKGKVVKKTGKFKTCK
jgi:hypothetical protein